MIKQRKVLIEKYNIEYPLDDLFRELIPGCYKVKFKPYPNSIFYKKNNEIIMELDLIRNNIFIDISITGTIIQKLRLVQRKELDETLYSLLEKSFNTALNPKNIYTIHFANHLIIKNWAIINSNYNNPPNKF